MKKKSIRESGLVGTLYDPETPQKKAGIVLLSGSDGGIPGTNAIPEPFIEHLVKKGFVVLALAYFGVEGLPAHLENIPLEYFETAIDWLKPLVKEIGIIGQSRGGELALLLGTKFPNSIQSIVASAPCSMVCGGFPYPNRPAWTYRGSPVSPFLSALTSLDKDLTESDDLRSACKTHANTAEDPYILADLFTARISKRDAAIEVEKIRCPLLLLSGDQDAIWPAKIFCESVMKRLEQYQSTVLRKAHQLPERWTWPHCRIRWSDLSPGRAFLVQIRRSA